MQVKIAESWLPCLKEEFSAPYYKELENFVNTQYREHTCYPPEEQVFAAFDHCSPEQLKVVILGQDPYHGEGQANGLCFSVNEGIPHPPSLKNILKEVSEDTGISYPESGNLERWAEQGVLLLNATLSVRQSQAGSHQRKGWEKFTDNVIKKISSQNSGIVFLLWGGYAAKKAKLIDAEKHHVLISGHPSPLSANRGFWFGNGHFTKCNTILKEMGKAPIIW
ncbi:uracil-DNA glycosylase [Robertkochia solimangrovi]|uniref:uracil-DNA glycosylase n=1 Tax=Robertkochia solimangrovi TaxID=2213046 RepID=UPI00118052F3|nr:uracil-DNA glycosylase [Robertkochia solimangrovi]TRZ45440.1 uracil-DNA glycosylase [Robertkochia solimangrovi]